MPWFDSSYDKPFRSVDEQIDLLESRGMQVGPRPDAVSTLRAMGYYRLSGYWYPYRRRKADDAGQTVVLSEFESGTRLADVVVLHDSDSALRRLLAEALEIVEVSIRFHIGHALGAAHPFAHRDERALAPEFVRRRDHRRRGKAHLRFRARDRADAKSDAWQKRYEREERRSRETFVAHFRERYGPHLPVWVATEVMSFGVLSELYDAAPQTDRERIALAFGLVRKDGRGDSALFANWLNHLRHVRNLCAHHSRLWNRVFDVQLASSKDHAELMHVSSEAGRRVFGTMAVLAYLVTRIAPASDWRLRARQFLQEWPSLFGDDKARIDLVRDWNQHELWRDVYEPDVELADRARLLAEFEVESRAGAEAKLTVREPKQRRSWLNWLVSRRATMVLSFGAAKLFPAFQFVDGDARQRVADLNEALFERFDGEGREADEVWWLVLRWWATPHRELDGQAPRDAADSELHVDLAQSL